MQFKSKRPASPKAGDTIPLVVTRTVTAKNDTPAANQPKHGKLNYLAGPPKKKASKPSLPSIRAVEKKSFSIGRYIGNGESLTAFVMLDPDEVPKDRAENE